MLTQKVITEIKIVNPIFRMMILPKRLVLVFEDVLFSCINFLAFKIPLELKKIESRMKIPHIGVSIRIK